MNPILLLAVFSIFAVVACVRLMRGIEHPKIREAQRYEKLKEAQRKRMTCKHGSSLGVSQLQGPWAGPTSKCRCCRSTFGFVEGAHTTSAGETVADIWSPRDLCGQCGGRLSRAIKRPAGSPKARSQ